MYVHFYIYIQTQALLEASCFSKAGRVYIYMFTQYIYIYIYIYADTGTAGSIVLQQGGQSVNIKLDLGGLNVDMGAGKLWDVVGALKKKIAEALGSNSEALSIAGVHVLEQGSVGEEVGRRGGVLEQGGSGGVSGEILGSTPMAVKYEERAVDLEVIGGDFGGVAIGGNHSIGSNECGAYNAVPSRVWETGGRRGEKGVDGVLQHICVDAPTLGAVHDSLQSARVKSRLVCV